jgi:sugar phosphate isomerase/epimerase
MNPDRPVLLCIIQFQDQIEANEMSVQDAVEQAVSYSVQGIELRRELWPAYEEELEVTRRLLQDRGLIATYATFSRLFAVDDAAHRLLLHDIETAAFLGAPFLRVFQGGLPADEDAAGWAKAREAIDYAESLGIRIALENLGGPPGHRATDIKQVLDRLDSPTLVTNFDIGNYFELREDLDTALDLLGPKIAGVHLKDNSGRDGIPPQPLGAGIMPMAHILTRLDALPQEIYYCLEVGGGDDPHAKIRRSLDYLAAH